MRKKEDSIYSVINGVNYDDIAKKEERIIKKIWRLKNGKSFLFSAIEEFFRCLFFVLCQYKIHLLIIFQATYMFHTFVSSVNYFRK